MPTLCKAAITRGDGSFFIDEIEIGEPARDEVLVKIKASGICHTDFDSLAWGKKMIPGHEGAGVVMKCGEGVSNMREGDHVILNWAIPCHNCYQCHNGHQNLCERNSFVMAGNSAFSEGHAHPHGTLYKGEPLPRSFNLGTLSEYTLVKESAVVPVPKEVPFPSASIVGCGVMTGYGSVMNAAKVQSLNSVAVIGCGGVGLNVIQAAHIAGAAPIIAIDTRKSRLDFARKFGATHTLLAETSDKEMLQTTGQVKSLTNGRGVDFAFECTAIPEMGTAPLRLVRHGGMALQLSGIEQEITFDMRLFEWDKIYLNPLYGQCSPQVDFPKIIGHYLNKELLLDELVTATYSLDQLQNAFDDMLSGKNAKGVIVFS